MFFLLILLKLQNTLTDVVYHAHMKSHLFFFKILYLQKKKKKSCYKYVHREWLVY